MVKSKGGDHEIVMRDIPKPHHGEMLIKVCSAALNPIDWRAQDYGFMVEQFPAILGMDAAGEVMEVGDDVRDFKKGDRVLTHGRYDKENDHACFQQYMLCKADFTAMIPSKFAHKEHAFDSAATIPLGFNTASVGLFGRDLGAGLTPPWKDRSKYRNRPMMIMGGATSVGCYTIQLARYAGFSPIMCTASMKNEKYLKDLGAHHVFDRDMSPEDLKMAVQKHTKDPIRVVFDTVSQRETQEAGWNLLSDDGLLIVTLEPKVEPGSGDRREVISTRGSPHLGQNKDFSKETWSQLSEWLKNERIMPNRFEVQRGGLNGIENGLDMLRDERVSAMKLVVHPHETS